MRLPSIWESNRPFENRPKNGFCLQALPALRTDSQPFPCPIPTMSFSAQLTEDIKTAMKAKDTVALNVVRGLKSALKYAAIEKLGAEGELGEADALAVVRKEIKKRQDSVASYEQAGRQDLADTEKAEITVLEKYLPAAMSAEEITRLVESVITELGATSKKEMGAVMKVLQERSGGRADGKTLSGEVSKRLA